MKKSIALIAAAALLAGLAVSCASGAPAKTDAKADTKAAAPAANNIVLKATKAKLTKGGGEGILVEAGGNIGYWSSTGDLIAWEFEAAEGEYSVVVDYAVDKEFANAKATVTVGDTVLAWDVASTGTWADYKKLELGTVKLAAGTNTLTMQATAIINRFVANVKSVTLVKK